LAYPSSPDERWEDKRVFARSKRRSAFRVNV
jgi:hypothetical protein